MPVFSRPSAQQFSSVNFAANTPANPNLAVVTIGSDGQFCYDGAVSDHHVILDLVGIVPGANINAIDPTRILDTRSGAKLNANSSRCVAAPGGSAGDVAVVNITNTAATGGGYGAVRASGTMPVFSRPSAQQFSSVNFAANTPANPNLAVVTIGSDGQFCYDGAVSDHHVILDLVGIVPGANINAIDPTRILDTRSGAKLNANSSRCAAAPGGSAGDVAVVNITNTAATGGGYGAVRASVDAGVQSAQCPAILVGQLRCEHAGEPEPCGRDDWFRRPVLLRRCCLRSPRHSRSCRDRSGCEHQRHRPDTNPRHPQRGRSASAVRSVVPVDLHSASASATVVRRRRRERLPCAGCRSAQLRRRRQRGGLRVSSSYKPTDHSAADDPATFRPSCRVQSVVPGCVHRPGTAGLELL